MSRAENEKEAVDLPLMAKKAGSVKALVDYFETVDAESALYGIDLRGRDLETRKLVWTARAAIGALRHHLNPWRS